MMSVTVRHDLQLRQELREAWYDRLDVFIEHRVFFEPLLTDGERCMAHVLVAEHYLIRHLLEPTAAELDMLRSSLRSQAMASPRLQQRRDALLHTQSIKARRQKQLLTAEENLFYAAQLQPECDTILGLLEWVQVTNDRHLRCRPMDLYTTVNHQSRTLTWKGNRKHTKLWFPDRERAYQGLDGFRSNWPRLICRDEEDTRILRETCAARPSVLSMLTGQTTPNLPDGRLNKSQARFDIAMSHYMYTDEPDLSDIDWPQADAYHPETGDEPTLLEWGVIYSHSETRCRDAAVDLDGSTETHRTRFWTSFMGLMFSNAWMQG